MQNDNKLENVLCRMITSWEMFCAEQQIKEKTFVQNDNKLGNVLCRTTDKGKTFVHNENTPRHVLCSATDRTSLLVQIGDRSTNLFCRRECKTFFSIYIKNKIERNVVFPLLASRYFVLKLCWTQPFVQNQDPILHKRDFWLYLDFF